MKKAKGKCLDISLRDLIRLPKTAVMAQGLIKSGNTKILHSWVEYKNYVYEGKKKTQILEYYYFLKADKIRYYTFSEIYPLVTKYKMKMFWHRVIKKEPDYLMKDFIKRFSQTTPR